jgi:GDPmannose 4,6-dehydratase
MSKKVLICGISGQDGAYLAEHLLKKGYAVFGSSRDAELGSFANLHRLGIYESVQLVSLNLRDVAAISALLKRIRPDHIYSLAGQTSVGLSFDQPVETIESIAVGTLNILEAIRQCDLDTRFYNAGSSETFGDTGGIAATEESPLHPRSPYAVAKASAFWVVANYRESYNMFSCTGILSNHDSPLRPRRFVTRKIIHAAASLALGLDVKLKLGNLNIERDWGWAPEYVTAIALMLQAGRPDDFIIATGKSFSLVEFVSTAYSLINKNWQDYVSLDDHLMRPSDIARTRLDPGKAKLKLGWEATYAMPQVVSMMLEAEIEQLRSSNG